jgi:hypothetical protein
MQGKLTFANTVEQFDAGDCDGGVVEVLEAEHGPGSGLWLAGSGFPHAAKVQVRTAGLTKRC